MENGAVNFESAGIIIVKRLATQMIRGMANMAERKTRDDRNCHTHTHCLEWKGRARCYIVLWKALAKVGAKGASAAPCAAKTREWGDMIHERLKMYDTLETGMFVLASLKGARKKGRDLPTPLACEGSCTATLKPRSLTGAEFSLPASKAHCGLRSRWIISFSWQ